MTKGKQVEIAKDNSEHDAKDRLVMLKELKGKYSIVKEKKKS